MDVSRAISSSLDCPYRRGVATFNFLTFSPPHHRVSVDLMRSEPLESTSNIRNVTHLIAGSTLYDLRAIVAEGFKP